MPQWQIDSLDSRLFLLSGTLASPPLTARQISAALRAFAKRVFGANDNDINVFLLSRHLPL